MWSKITHRPRVSIIAMLSGALMIVVVAYAVYVAGQLPWQEDPTRIPVTPFEGIPGFTIPTPMPTATPPAS